MKEILKLKGVKILSREEKVNLKGGVFVYCKTGYNRICFLKIGNKEFAEPGICMGNGRCAWF